MENEDYITNMLMFSQVQYEKIIELTKAQIEDRVKIALLNNKCGQYAKDIDALKEQVAVLENENEDLKHELKMWEETKEE